MRRQHKDYFVSTIRGSLKKYQVGKKINSLKYLEEHPTMAEKEFFLSFFGAEARLLPFYSSRLHVKSRCRGPKLSNHSISIGGRNLILEKNLYF